MDFVCHITRPLPSYLMNAQLPSFSPQFSHFFFQPEDHFCPRRPNSPSASYQLPTVATSSRITQLLPTTYTQATPSQHLRVSPRIITVRRLVNNSSATQGSRPLVREPFHCIPQGFQSRGNISQDCRQASNDCHCCFSPGENAQLRLISRHGLCPHSREVYCNAFYSLPGLAMICLLQTHVARKVLSV